MRATRRAFAFIALAALLLACTARLKPTGSAVMEPAITPNSFVQADGTKMLYRTWQPDGKPRAAIATARVKTLSLILHGSRDELVPQHPTLDDAARCQKTQATAWRCTAPVAPAAARSESADGVGRDRGVDSQSGRAAAVRRDQGSAGGAAGAVKQVQAISPFPNLPIAARRRARCVPRASERSPFKIETAQGTRSSVG